MLRKVALLALSLWMAATFLVGGSPMASADGPTTDAQQEAFIRENLSRNGVSTQTQDALIAKLERGEAWDSLKGATPVSSEVRHANGTRVQTDRYADGSVAVATIEAPSVSDVKPGSDGKARPASVVRFSADGFVLVKGSPIQVTAWMEANYGISNNAWTTHN